MPGPNDPGPPEGRRLPEGYYLRTAYSLDY
jgi:hypothetical protein